MSVEVLQRSKTNSTMGAVLRALITEDAFFKFKVCKSLYHHTIQINHQLDVTIFSVYYPDFYLQLNVFRASSRPLSGAQQLQ
jgi:hypothetical protein